MPTPVLAAAGAPVATPAGACTGVTDGSVDCVTATGHISASVVGTLSINEVRAVSFGDFAFSAASDGTGSALINPLTNARTVSTGTADTIIGMHGNNGGVASSLPGNANSGGQSYGIYHISGGEEDATGTTAVYISFYTSGGEPLNICDPDGTNCDTGYAAPTAPVKLDATTAGPYFTVDNFSFANGDGTGDAKDVYGRYTITDGTGVADVKVGALMHTHAADVYTPGKYTGTFNINVSY